MIVAEPNATPVITPEELTVAIFVFDDVYVIVPLPAEGVAGRLIVEPMAT